MEGELVLSCVPSSGDGPFDVAGSSTTILGVKDQGALGITTTTTTGAMPGASFLSLKKMNAVLGGHENQRRVWKEKTNTTGKGQDEGWI